MKINQLISFSKIIAVYPWREDRIMDADNLKLNNKFNLAKIQKI